MGKNNGKNGEKEKKAQGPWQVDHASNKGSSQSQMSINHIGFKKYLEN